MIPTTWRLGMVATTAVTLGALVVAGQPVVAEERSGPDRVVAAPEVSGGDANPVQWSAATAASAELAAEYGVSLQAAVLSELEQQPHTDFWVVFEEQADLTGAYEIEDWAQRGEYVHARLVETAQASQAWLSHWLRMAGVSHERFWSVNAVLVRGADLEVLERVVAEPGVAEVRADEVLEAPDPIEVASEAGIAQVEWGVANIGADRVWAELDVRGEGVVVGVIDTGAQFTHPALERQYRGNLGNGAFSHDHHWWDPSQVCPEPEPCDNHNHGTHVTGTILGDDGAGNQIGVAPGAQWISAKGCEQRSCSQSALLSSGEFMLAPTNLAGGNPRPDLRPHIVNNSWGGASGSTWFDHLVAAWHAAGIFPVFSNGNSGPGCGTAGAPADGPDAFAVGAHNLNDVIAGFSSRGPGRGEVKPELTAPGVNVRSSVVGGYGLASGTSMAAPHVSGAVALLWSASGLAGDVAAARATLLGTAVAAEDLSCGGIPEHNNVYGHGRMDAWEATLQVAVSSGISGVVVDADGVPVEGARVTSGTRSRQTDEAGRFTLRIEPGTYDLEVSRFGHVTTTVSEVTVTDDEFTPIEVTLPRAPSGTITGTITDEISGETMPGVTVRVREVPADLSAVTDQAGNYQIPDVPAETYQVGADPGRPANWTPVTAEVTVPAEATVTHDITMPPGFGAVDQVSVSSNGIGSNRLGSTSAKSSADGRFVVFASEATNLVDAVVTARSNVYLHDRQTGVTELISVSSDGEIANDWAVHPAISADGRYVAFLSGATNLVAEPPAPEPTGTTRWHIYLRDRLTGVTELVEVTAPGEAPGVNGLVMTPDARYLAFASQAPMHFDPTGVVPAPLPVCDPRPQLPRRVQMCRQVFLHDRVTGETELVSVNSAGEAGTADSTQPAVSANGRIVAFRSAATNLVPEQTSAGDDVFVHDRQTGQTGWISDQLLDDALVGGYAPQVSGDGRYVAYVAGGGATSGAGPAALHDLVSGETELLLGGADPAEVAMVLAVTPQFSGDSQVLSYAMVAVDASFTPLPEATDAFVVDIATGEHRRLVDSHDGSPPPPLDVVALPLALDYHGDSVVVLGGHQLMPGVPVGAEEFFVVNRDYDPDQPRARVLNWDLAVTPAQPEPGAPVEVTTRLKNLGTAPGDYEAAVLINDAGQNARELVSLAPGETAEVSLTVTRESGGSALVRVGQHTSNLRVPAGSLLGEVLDANDQEPIDGAVVTAVNGRDTRAVTTFAGGAFEFGDLQVGTWQVTASAENYRGEPVELVVAEDGQRLAAELSLRTGAVATEPAAVEVVLASDGGHSVPVELGNPGTAELTWRGHAWQAAALAPSTLVYVDDLVTPPGETAIDRALQRLGLEYTAFYREQQGDLQTQEDFREALVAGDWDLVIAHTECVTLACQRLTSDTLDALDDQLAGGGRLIVSEWRATEADHRLWERMGLTIVEEVHSMFYPPDPVLWWEPEHPLLTQPLPVPESTDRVRRCNACGLRVEPVGGGQALAGYTTVVDLPGMANLVLGAGGRSLFRGFGDLPNDADQDRSGIPDAEALWVNSIIHIGGLTVAPWLAVDEPGTLAPGGIAELAVSIDTAGMGPGSYHGSVEVVSDAGRTPQVSVPVTLTVVAPVSCDRTITGTHRGPLTVTDGVTCLAEGAAVNGPVQVREGAGLAAHGASISGPVTATGASVVELRGSTVAGPVTVTGASERVMIVGSEFAGPVTIAGNDTGDLPVVFAGNRVSGSLSCSGNQPAVIDNGDPNQVTGPRSGQCAEL